MHRCETFTSAQSYGSAQVDRLCQGVGGTSATSCTVAGRVGFCSFTVGGLAYALSFYQDDNDVALTKQNCGSLLGGTWTDG